MAAYPDTRGQLRSNTLKAAAAVLQLGVGADKLSAALAQTRGETLEDEARSRRGDGMSITQGFAEVIAQACGTTTVKPPTERALRHRAKKAKVKSTPFHFTRSTAPPPKAKPVEIRGNVPVRRIEPGQITELVTRTLTEAGFKIERNRGAQPYKLNGKAMTFEGLIARADEIRVRKGLEPLRKVAS